MSAPIRLLYAEDNPQDAELTRACLASHGRDFELEVVGTGSACLERLAAAPFDVVLLDQYLPDMDGLEVLRKLVLSGSSPPAVMITGMGDEELVVRALRLGAANYIPKAGDYLATLPDLLRDVIAEHRRKERDGLLAPAVRRILYIEHHPMDIELTVRQFAETAPHYVVDAVQSCGEALARLGAPHSYDLVLIDLRMPDRNALDFVAEARRLRLALPPFIVITGKGDDSTAIATLRLGAADYIVKRDGYLEQLTYLADRVIAHRHQSVAGARLREELAASELARAELRFATRRLEFMAQITSSVVGSASTEDIAQALAEQVRECFAVDACIIRVLEGDQLVLLAAAGVPRGELAPSLPIFGISQEIFATLRPLAIHDVRTDPRTQNLAVPRHGTYSFISFAGVPLMVQEKPVGILGMYSAREPRDFTPTDLEHLSIVGNHVAIILSNERLYHALREKEGLLAESQRVALLGSWMLDLPGRTLTWSDEMYRLHGVSRETFVPTIEGAMALIHPDDQSAAWECARAGLEGRNLGAFVFRLIRPEGGVRFLRCQSEHIRDSSGKLVRLIGTVQDITESKQAEEALRNTQQRLQQAVAAGNIGLWDWDLRTSKVFYSREWKSQIGYEDHEIGNDLAEWEKRVHPEDLAPTMQKVRDYLEGKTASHEVEFRFRHKDGTYRQILARASKILDAQGIPIRMLGTHVDITERKRAEEERDSLAAQLRQAQKIEAIGQLAGGVAHDFNNMLGVMLGNAEMALHFLGDAPRKEELRNSLNEILKAGHRSADLTRQLLAFARKQTIAPKVLDLNDTVAGMLKILGRLIGEQIELVWKPGGNLARINMDPAQVDQILANLSVNARDAIAGVGRLTIETGNAELDETFCAAHPGTTPGRYARLSVTDTGCGMTPETMERIFEPFFTTKDFGKGTGLGLATVYGIVKQNNGSIQVQSEPGRGSTFDIFIPAMERVSAAEEAAEKRPPRPMGTETVLLVEDEGPLLTLSRRMLERLGYTVLAFGTPGEALRTAASHAGDIHLLLTDVVMPEMSGRDLHERLLAIRPGIGCLFVSGYTHDVIAREGVLVEGIHFLRKPFSIDALAAKVREALGR